MPDTRCPGQDLRYWKPDDIFDAPCIHCRAAVEFFKDDLKRRCPACGQETRNPRNDMACAAWCPSADSCLQALGLVKPDRNDR